MSMKDRITDFIVSVMSPHGNRQKDARTLTEVTIGQGNSNTMRMRFVDGAAGIYCIVEHTTNFFDVIIMEIDEEQTMKIFDAMERAYGMREGSLRDR